jgi:hypothetical protein
MMKIDTLAKDATRLNSTLWNLVFLCNRLKTNYFTNEKLNHPSRNMEENIQVLCFHFINGVFKHL